MPDYLNPIRIIVLLTFILFLFRFDKSKKVHVLLLAILTVSLINEILSAFLKHHHSPIHLSNNVYTIINLVLWLWLLGRITGKVKTSLFIISLLLLISISNFICLGGMETYHNYTLICGAFLYVGLFIYDCYLRLKQEDLAYFSSNNYTLTAAPLLFFIGFSVLFGFQNKPLHETQFYGMKLFKIVSYFINTIYYLLLNIYIYKEKTNPNDQ
jgi:hypothetical protein